MTIHERTYLSYLLLAAVGGLPPDSRRWDRPCPQFQAAGAELLRLGYARRRWIAFGPIGITRRGVYALGGTHVQKSDRFTTS